MKTHTSKFLILGSLLALMVAFAAPAVRAEDGAKEKKVSKKNLEKYDTNKDGKLDDAEKAAMEADKAKNKAKKDKAAKAGEPAAQEK
jgi:hypothetical protein